MFGLYSSMIIYGVSFLGAHDQVCAMFVRSANQEIAVSWKGQSIYTLVTELQLTVSGSNI